MPPLARVRGCKFCWLAASTTCAEGPTTQLFNSVIKKADSIFEWPRGCIVFLGYHEPLLSITNVTTLVLRTERHAQD